MKMAILGLGEIGSNMARTINKMDDIETYAVAARDLSRAESFRDTYGFEKAYGSYGEMLADKEVDLVYVATPHSHHYAHVKLCLEAGKHVLCEKAFTVNDTQAKELIRLAEEKHLLLAEAIWTRYLPSRTIITDIIHSGAIGEVSSMTANIGYYMPTKERIWEPNLAGGALLDIGVYMLNLARMVFPKKITKIIGSAEQTEKKVDGMNSVILHFEDGEMATLHCSAKAVLNLNGSIFGTKGYLEIENINNPEEIRQYDENRKLVKTHQVPEQITGFEYQVRACKKAIEENQIECKEMPHSEIIYIMEIMSGLLKEWGYEIPTDIC